MKSFRKSCLFIVLFGFCFFNAWAQDNFSGDSQPFLSPEQLEQFQNNSLPAEQKSRKTLKTQYRNVNFIDLRSIDATAVVDSGYSGEQGNFDSINGYSFGLTWEFPILTRQLGGDTPILKARAGKTEIKASEMEDSNIQLSESSEKFVDSLGVSEVYTVGLGVGYCYHVGFDCMYAMYNTYLTGQMTAVENDGTVSTVPTQLKGISVGMTSSFETALGIEMTVGLEYSLLTHSTPLYDDQNLNTFSLVFGLGFLDQSRYLNMQEIEFVE